MFVTIDPGQQTGWALWNVAGLVACGLGDPRSHERHRVVALDPVDVVDDVWIESQVIYPRSRARPADIVKLAQGAGEWAGLYRALGVPHHYVEPAWWKGQVPKDIHHARVWAALREPEKQIVEASCKGIAPSKRHNVLDAVGLGLWVVKRGPRP